MVTMVFYSLFVLVYVQVILNHCLGSQQSTPAIAADSSKVDKDFTKGDILTFCKFIEHLLLTIMSFSSSKEDQEPFKFPECR